MSTNFEKVKQYLFELGFIIRYENPEEELVVISDQRIGINNLIIDCEDPILVLEQHIFDLKDKNDSSVLLRLLQMNRQLVHGAFVVDETGTKVLFRDILELENLDLNKIKSSIHSLSIAMAEFLGELLSFGS